MNYDELSDVLKVIADPNRLKILELISCEGLKACEILEYFHFSQPTLSYHMKLLYSSGLVHKSRQGRWIFYRLNDQRVDQVKEMFQQVFGADQSQCLCQEIRLQEAER